jgi:autotransporter-associated beta strand protein
LFGLTSTAANATIIANGGTNGGSGGDIQFIHTATGGSCRVELFDSGSLDLSNREASSTTIGSLEGSGIAYLGQYNLAVGSNDLTTTFSGLIRDGGGYGGHGGSLTKIGAGSLTLSGMNAYTGGTAVESGALVVTNTTGSATGPGAVGVNGGTLGGSGIIAGATTIGTGSGTGAFLAPAAGSNVQAALTIQSALTFNADATYACTFKAKQHRASTDQVIANGITINSGAALALRGRTRGALRQGLALTLISNTSANPISGTFGNLPDGGIVTVNGNNLQASYQGGDGNDLTLTVVP